MGFGTIFFIVVAAIVLFQLRNVLGRRTGNERPPFDPYTRPEKPAEAQGNVVTLPNRRETAPVESASVDSYAAIDRSVPPADPVNAQLRRVKDLDQGFDPKPFLEGAKAAYEMIVTAFSAGDRKTLKSLLSTECFQGFDQAITERQQRGETLKSTFIGFDATRIAAAEVKDREVQITVRFVSQLISVVENAAGEVVDGDRESVVEVKDRWTFARDTRSRDPNWKLIETQSENEAA